MSAIIQFKCRACDGEIAIGPDLVPGRSQASCPRCRHSQEVRVPASMTDHNTVTSCVACGHEDLFIQKDFNRSLGVVIVAAGVLASTWFFSKREPFYAMASLVVTALIDLLIYSLVGTVTVCYACHAVYRGFKPNPEHTAFDLKKLEKYGGRPPRFGA